MITMDTIKDVKLRGLPVPDCRPAFDCEASTRACINIKVRTPEKGFKKKHINTY